MDNNNMDDYKYVRVHKHYIDIIMDAIDYANPKTSFIISNNATDSEDISEKTIENLKAKFRGDISELDAESIEITENEILLAHDSVLKYKKHLQSTLSNYKQGTAQYNKTKKAINAIPRIMSTIFSSVYDDE